MQYVRHRIRHLDFPHRLLLSRDHPGGGARWQNGKKKEYSVQDPTRSRGKYPHARLRHARHNPVKVRFYSSQPMQRPRRISIRNRAWPSVCGRGLLIYAPGACDASTPETVFQRQPPERCTRSEDHFITLRGHTRPCYVGHQEGIQKKWGERPESASGSTDGTKAKWMTQIVRGDCTTAPETKVPRTSCRENHTYHALDKKNTHDEVQSLADATTTSRWRPRPSTHRTARVPRGPKRDTFPDKLSGPARFYYRLDRVAWVRGSARASWRSRVVEPHGKVSSSPIPTLVRSRSLPSSQRRVANDALVFLLA